MKEKKYLKNDKYLMAEYDFKKNMNVDLENITLGSHKKVWWKCQHGHEWQVSVSHRYRGRNCPYCSNQKVLEGFNDLTTTCPELSKEWNYQKNGLLKPNNVVRGSEKVVWWKCQHGHEWQDSLNHRSHGAKCPYCSNKMVLNGYNDLATTNPELSKEWDYQKNGCLNPNSILESSKKIVWWKCQHGHEWQDSLNHRSHGAKCPYCSNKMVLKGYNDLATANPQIASEWDYDKNKNITPYNTKSTSDKKVWWKCNTCGFEWESSIYYRTKFKSQCPSCQANNGNGKKLIQGVNDLESWCKNNNKKSILNEWNHQKNGKLLPRDISYGSGKMIWWKCKNGHEYIQRVNHKTGKEDCGCPYCTGVKVLKGFNDLESWCKKNNRLDILNEYRTATNNKKADEVLFSSTKKYNFICPFGHSYSRDLYDKTLNFAHCPVCQKSNKISVKEKTVYYYLKKYIADVVENYVIDKSTQKELDIYIPSYKIAIEYDGQFYHINKKRDIEKNMLCKKHNIVLFRIREPKLDKLPFCHNIKLNDESIESLEKIIVFLLNKLGIKEYDVDIKRDAVDIQNLVIKYNISNSFQQWCIENKKEEYLLEWDKKRNGKVTPLNVSYGTTQKYYFMCKNGHSYLQSIALRTRNGVGCPYCDCKKIMKGFNDFKTWCINNKKIKLLSEWNYEKNGSLLPDSISHGTTKKVWWKCEKGHEWLASLNNRSCGRNCPICSNKVIVKGINDLASHNSKILLMWNYDNNIGILPSEVSPFSGKIVWWKCPKCSNEWKQRISHISKGVGCPRCHYNILK